MSDLSQNEPPAEAPSTADPATPQRASTGAPGLDDILNGGLPGGRVHLAQGGPGTGKTTLGLQFLRAGAQQGERVLYVTLAQTEQELRAIARSHDWDLDGVGIFELAPEDVGTGRDGQTILEPAEVELNETAQAVLEAVEDANPERVVFDSMAETRLLAGEPLRFRREIMRFKQVFSRQGVTALLLDDAPDRSGDNELEVLVHGTLRLERRSPDYGSDRRRLQVAKLHGADYHDGWHDVRIRKGAGVEVFPRLKIEDRVQPGTREAVRSGVGGLDDLLEGGLELGTACLLTGPDGAGKTSLATLYLHAAASSGRCGAAYLFDERPGTFFARGESLGMDLKPFAEDDMIDVRTIQTGEISPGEFAHRVREDVVERGAEIVCIDSLSGYVNAMPQERLLMIHMQELLSFLNRQEVLTLLIVSESGVVGSVQHKEVEIGYMADSVVLLRHFEAEGTIRQAISAVKRRHGQHERTIRELQITPEEGIAVGPPITAFSGVLSGTPAFEGETDVLLERRSGDSNGDPASA